jgi:hypothetical protein
MSGYEMESEHFANRNESDMRARLRVWAALGQIFHGDQLHERDYDRMAGELLAAGETAESVRHILLQDVAPVFYEKFTVMGGNGTHWPAGVVEKMMRDFANKSDARRQWLRVQARRMFRPVMSGGWSQIELRMRLASLLDEA